MTDAPQKTSHCKFCGQEITWKQDPVTGKNYPKNLNGSAHLCKSGKTEEDKRKAAGFDNPPCPDPVWGNTENCTSSQTPAVNLSNSTGLKIVEGQIVAIDHAAHKVTVKDRAGTQHTMIWPAPLNEQMGKLKQWWFTRLTGEQEKGFPDLWRLTAQEFYKRPEDWPVHGGSGSAGGWKGQPRNEKAIILQCCMKVAADVWMHTHMKIDDLNFEKAMGEITTEAKKAAGELCTAAGVQ